MTGPFLFLPQGYTAVGSTKVVLQGGGREVSHLASMAESGEHIRQPHSGGGRYQDLPKGPALLQCQEAVSSIAGHP